MNIQLYSFDIFDTLINRKTATPEGIFALMQQKLRNSKVYSEIPQRLTDNFYLIRIQAEKVARNTYIKNGVYDITLSQIYESISLMEELSAEQIESLMDLEIETEIENAIPVISNINKIKALIEKNKRVVLVSNMYLRECDIRRILVCMDIVFEDIPMYVSGDLGKTKGTHSLYHYVRQQENIEFAQWQHCGDNWNLDVEIPRKLGIQAEHFEQSKLLSWEEEILEENIQNPDLQMLLGISKRVKKEGSIAYNVGVGYSAEVLVPYVLWVIKESVKKGIKKLFFIARDGYILKVITDIIIEKYRYPIETAYLYGSRKAWRLPSLNKDDFDMNEFFTWNYPGQIYSYDRFAEIFGLTMEELKLILPCVQNEPKELSQALVRDIIGILAENQKYVIEVVTGKQKEKRDRVIQYLYQELGDEKDYAFVDLIGSGYTQKCLSDLMKEFCDEPIRTFFYRLDSCRKYERNVNYVYFPNRITLGNAIEILCGAMHGQTCDYEYCDGHWIPVLGEDEGAALQEYGFEAYLEGVKAYVEEMTTLYPNKQLEVSRLDVLEVYFDYMAMKKNDKLYDYIADMPYTITGQERKVSSFAPKLTNKDLRKIYIWNKGRNSKKYYSGYSLEFSLLRITEKQKRSLEFYKRHSDDAIVKFIRKAFYCKKRDFINSKYDLIADKIVLYGAGKKGQLLYEQLTNGKDYHAEVVLWADKNYSDYTDLGMEIHAPEEIIKSEYQQVIIAVASQKVANEIKNELVEKGISPIRILWINPDNKVR